MTRTLPFVSPMYSAPRTARRYRPAHARRGFAADAPARCAIALVCAVLMAGSLFLSWALGVREGLFLHALDVPVVLQDPLLPNGREAASLASALQFAGEDADMLDLAYAYIPREDFYTVNGARFGPSPQNAYAGDPAGLGFYCFAAPVAAGANEYLAAACSALRARDATGVTAEGLRAYLSSGTPVLVWITTDGEAPRLSAFSWTVPSTGETVTGLANSHCVVLTALGRTRARIMDPLCGERTLTAGEFLFMFEKMGSRAVALT